MKKNPYQKYLGKEDVLQSSVMNYLKLNYPNVFAIHVPNEGKRSPFERYKFKYLGGISGVPDLLIFAQNKKYCGLAIELKVGYNKPTESQQSCLESLKKLLIVSDELAVKLAQLAFVLSLIKSIIVVGFKRMDKVFYGSVT